MIDDFLKEKKANGVKDTTIHNARKSLMRLDKFKTIDTCTEADLKEYFACLKCSERTKELYKIYIKQYFRWCSEHEKVSWIKSKKVQTTVQEEDLLTSDEVTKMLNVTEHPREKAMIAVLDESGGRISEILNLNIKDLVKTEYGFRIGIRNGKTGSRDISLINSVPHVVNWINFHPLKDKPDAPLFVNLGQRAHHKRLTPNAFRKVLKEIVDRAGIKKRVHPHLFRHSALTNFAQSGMQESILRRLAGWSGSSSMPEVYIHVGNKDVEREQLALHGKAEIQKKILDNPLTKECTQCHRAIPIDAQFCEHCSKHQDLSSVVKQSIERQKQLEIEFEDMKKKMEAYFKLQAAKT